MVEKKQLLEEIKELEEKRNALFAQVGLAEQFEQMAWDSYNALADHLESLEQKKRIANDYWGIVQRNVVDQMEFILSRTDRIKMVVSSERYDLLVEEMDELAAEVEELAEELGIEISKFPKKSPFFELEPNSLNRRPKDD